MHALKRGNKNNVHHNSNESYNDKKCVLYIFSPKTPKLLDTQQLLRHGFLPENVTFNSTLKYVHESKSSSHRSYNTILQKILAE